MLNGGSMVWGFCVYFVYMIPLETDVLRKHRFQKEHGDKKNQIKISPNDQLDYPVNSVINQFTNVCLQVPH